MLYAVPQTDSTTEPAMAALVARLRAAQPKPATIPTEVSTPGTDAALALQLSEVVDRIGSALGDRAVLPLMRWDGALDGVCRKIAYRDWINTRGRERGKGGDLSIDTVADAAEAYLARCRPGGDENGKTENPRFDDAQSNIPQDAGLFRSARRSDGWVQAQRHEGRR